MGQAFVLFVDKVGGKYFPVKWKREKGQSILFRFFLCILPSSYLSISLTTFISLLAVKITHTIKNSRHRMERNMMSSDRRTNEVAIIKKKNISSREFMWNTFFVALNNCTLKKKTKDLPYLEAKVFLSFVDFYSFSFFSPLLFYHLSFFLFFFLLSSLRMH